MEENNKNLEEIPKESRETKDAVIVIPHYKISFTNDNKTIITEIPRKAADKVAGHKMSRAEIKERLIAGIVENGEYMREEEKEKDKKREERKSRFKPKYLIPIIMAALLTAGITKCAIESNEPQIETIPIEMTLYDIDNPAILQEAAVNSSGQEGLTANLIDGSGLNGEYYSFDLQSEAEKNAVEDVNNVQTWKASIDSLMNILGDTASTTEQKKEAIQQILVLEQQIRSIYLENLDMVQVHTSSFANSSEAFRDSNTNNEIITVNLMLEQYMKQLGLSSENVASLEQIKSLLDQGFELNIESVDKELDGDYQITGEMIREVIDGTNIKDAAKTWEKVANNIKHLNDKTTEQAVKNANIQPNGATPDLTEENTGEERD